MRHQELSRFRNQRRLRKNKKKSGFGAYFSPPPNNVSSLRGVNRLQSRENHRLFTFPAMDRTHRAWKNYESVAYPLIQKRVKSHRSSSLLVFESARQGQRLQLTRASVWRTGLTHTVKNTKITGIAMILNDKIPYLYNLFSHGFCYSKSMY